MYKRQLEEQECISNSNIMRVKKFQRDLEAAESRALDAESTLDSFRYWNNNLSLYAPLCESVCYVRLCYVPFKNMNA